MSRCQPRPENRALILQRSPSLLSILGLEWINRVNPSVSSDIWDLARQAVFGQEPHLTLPDGMTVPTPAHALLRAPDYVCFQACQDGREHPGSYSEMKLRH